MRSIQRIAAAGWVLAIVTAACLAGGGESALPEAPLSAHPLAAPEAGFVTSVECPPMAPSAGAFTTAARGVEHPLADLGPVDRIPPPPSITDPGIGVPTESLPPLAIPPAGGPESYWRAPTPGAPIGPPPIPRMPPSAKRGAWFCDCCDGDCNRCLHCFNCFRQRTHHGAVGFQHGRAWRYVAGEHHGFPFTHSHYMPRAAGASYNFGRWVPTRSFYYPYIPGAQAHVPYGFSPEPYYFPEAFYTSEFN